MRGLHITLGEEYKARVESGEELKESIFKDLYSKAAINLSEIIHQSEKEEDANNPNPEFYNNIIAFTGERGTGKTSAMTSFVNGLINGDIVPDLDSVTDKSRKFATLPMIDPSLFRGNDRLFEIIVTRMFAKFQNHVKKENANPIDTSSKRRMLTKFQRVYNDLKVLNQDKKEIYDKDVIEALSDLAYGTNLKSKFLELIEIYLEVLHNNSDYLIIPIDDFDLNITGAYGMLEDIRQFLIQKKIILVIACKVEQLKDAIRTEIVDKMEVLYNNKVKEQDGFYTEDYPKEKADRYLDKLIPLNRRLYTESVKFNAALPVVLNTTSKKFESPTAEQMVIELIYRQTGVFLPLVQTSQNYFVQRTLRQLIHQIVVIYNCSDVEKYATYLNSLKSDYLDGDSLMILEEVEQGLSANSFYREWLAHYGSKKESYNYREGQLTSFADLFKTYGEIGSSLGLVDFKRQRSVSFVALHYSIINLIKYKAGERKTIFNYQFYIDGLLYRDQDSKDTFSIKNLKRIMSDSIESKEELQFVLCFATNLGAETNLTQSILERQVSLDSQRFDYLQFNALNFITTLMNRDILTYEVDELEMIGNDSLLRDIREWSFEGIELFSNLYFVTVFEGEYKRAYERLRKNKELNRNPGEGLYVRLIEGFRIALSGIKKKYVYLQFDVEKFISNPIFKYWKQNLERCNHLIDVLHMNNALNQETPDDVKDLASELLFQYAHYFSGNFPSSQGAKLGMNYLIKRFSNHLNIMNELRSYRREMDNDLFSGLEKIEGRLKELAEVE